VKAVLAWLLLALMVSGCSGKPTPAATDSDAPAGEDDDGQDDTALPGAGEDDEPQGQETPGSPPFGNGTEPETPEAGNSTGNVTEGGGNSTQLPPSGPPTPVTVECEVSVTFGNGLDQCAAPEAVSDTGAPFGSLVATLTYDGVAAGTVTFFILDADGAEIGRGTGTSSPITVTLGADSLPQGPSVALQADVGATLFAQFSATASFALA
jgi:hypothetical protein